MDPVTNASASTVYINNHFGDTIQDLSEASVQELMQALAEAGTAPDGPGAEATANAIGAQAGEVAAEMIREKLEADDSIPEAKKNEINEAVDRAIADTGLDTPEEIADLMAEIKESHREFFEEEIQETMDKTTGGGDGGSTGGGKDGVGSEGGSSNWLVVMAKAMSKIAGKHLEKMIQGQKALSDLEAQVIDPDDTEALAAQASEMTQLTAEIQAHSQMFKMAQETTTTVIKNVGEALNSTVRKQ